MDEFEKYLRSEYDGMNHPELLELARKDGKSVSDSAGREEVIDILLGKIDAGENPITKHKELFMHYLGENRSFVEEALPCDGNCLEHPTEVFLLCFSQSLCRKPISNSKKIKM